MTRLFTSIALSGALFFASMPVASAYSASYTGRAGLTRTWVSSPSGNGWHTYTYTGRYGGVHTGSWYSSR